MPDVVLASATPSVMAMQQVTRNVPIVFVLTPDPVGSGIVDSLSHPGRNATGFTSNEFGLSVKWLELLKQVAPNISRVAVLRDPANELSARCSLCGQNPEGRKAWRFADRISVQD